MAQVIPTASSAVDPHMGKAREFAALSQQIKELSSRRDDLKAELSAVVVELGEPDGEGHIVLTLPSQVGELTGFRRQRRVSRSLDEEEALLVLTEKGLIDRCYPEVVVRQIDETEILTALAEGALTTADAERIFPEKVTWAFVPVKR